jgi:hypothetical protein
MTTGRINQIAIVMNARKNGTRMNRQNRDPVNGGPRTKPGCRISADSRRLFRKQTARACVDVNSMVQTDNNSLEELIRSPGFPEAAKGAKGTRNLSSFFAVLLGGIPKQRSSPIVLCQ